MISLRHHLISLVAVFLALAVGVLLGAAGISDRLLSAVAADRDDLDQRLRQLTAERNELVAAAHAADEFARRVGPAALRETLTDRSVLLVTTADADPADRDAVNELLTHAGARVTGEVALTEAVGDPARADHLRELAAALLPAGARLPTATDPGSVLGGLLGSVIVTAERPQPQQDGEAVLAGLTEAGFVKPAPAGLVLVLTGGALTGPDAPDAAAVVARMAAALDRAGGGVVLAGRTGSDSATGAVGVARADPTVARAVSTIDDVQHTTGRVAAVLALREQITGGDAGRYGSGVDAVDGPSPTA